MKVTKGRSQPEIAAPGCYILEAWFWDYDHFNHPGFDCDSCKVLVIKVGPPQNGFGLFSASLQSPQKGGTDHVHTSQGECFDHFYARDFKCRKLGEARGSLAQV